ncbi:hypothetical protein HRI_003962000 [Hibiscus trionum]|uniref:Endonuclease/exonuclease/phosphatase domain-containing protein n=1 Tax=Hibiscus trionum TaxID=183268 RepID=A0A9W7IUP0_HIBTR|nr:hypothetical protein HRI_003962000 [Hibiscus trionum]
MKNRLLGKSFGNIEIAGSIGAAGGLITLWDPKFFIADSKIIADKFIALFGTLVNCNLRCGIYNVYAPNDPKERKLLFDQLSEVIQSSNSPAILGGDFNAVLRMEEKTGASTNRGEISTFCKFLHTNDLMDLPLHGGDFTWFKGGNGGAASRIDRFIVAPDNLH